MELKPKVLLFDLDQTLLRSSKRLKPVFVFEFYRVFRKAGLAPSQILPFFKKLRLSLESPETFPNGTSFFNEERAGEVAKHYGFTKEVFHDSIAEIFRRAIEHFTPIEESLEILSRLKSSYRVVLATNPMWPVEVLKIRLARARLKIEDFEAVTHAGNMHSAKTRVSYYEELIQRLGVKPEECVMIGDSETKDGIAAQIGIPVFLIRDQFARPNPLVTTGTMGDLEMLLQRFSFDGIVANLRSQAGRAVKKWEHLTQALPGMPSFRLESSADEKPLLEWLKAKLQKGEDRIAVAGGDGSVNWVLNLIQKENLPIRLGMIGLGSSNDYHKPMERPAILHWKNIPFRTRFHEAAPSDLLKIEWDLDGKTEHRYSALNGSLGFTAYGNHEFNHNGLIQNVKKFSVNLAIEVAALRSLLFFKSHPISIHLDGASPVQMNLANLSFYKNRFFSGDFRYETEVSPTSGDFGVAWIQEQPKLRLIQILNGLAQGRSLHFKELQFSLAKNLVASSEKAFFLEVDGEMVLAKSVRVTVESKKALLCP